MIFPPATYLSLGLNCVLAQFGGDDSQVFEGRDSQSHLGGSLAKLVDQDVPEERQQQLCRRPLGRVDRGQQVLDKVLEQGPAKKEESFF